MREKIFAECRVTAEDNTIRIKQKIGRHYILRTIFYVDFENKKVEAEQRSASSISLQVLVIAGYWARVLAETVMRKRAEEIFAKEVQHFFSIGDAWRIGSWAETDGFLD